MHYTEGDGKLYDASVGHDVYADEDPPTRDATQLTHESANALTEEVANVIKSAGISLNSASESLAQMTQLKQAIDKKDTDVTNALTAIITALVASAIGNDSNVTGSTVKDAFNENKSRIDTNQNNIADNYNALLALDSSDVQNASQVSGSKVTNALDTLKTAIDTLDDKGVINTSSVAGANVFTALNNLLANFANYYTKTQSDANYGAPDQIWVTDTLDLMGGSSAYIGSDQYKSVGINASGHFGWSDLDVDDTIIVTRKWVSGTWSGKWKPV